MYRNLIWLAALFILSCSHAPDAHNAAERHMHRHSHEHLIQEFNDPKRDLWQKPQKVLSLIGKIEKLKVLDLGAGSGYFTRPFLETGAEVVAADIDDKFIAYLKQEFAPDLYPRFSVRKIEPMDPKLKSQEFDLIFTCNTYHHFEQREDYFKKVYSGLRANGRLVIVDFKKQPEDSHLSGPPMELRVSAQQVQQELEGVGFKLHLLDEISLPRQYVVIMTKAE